MTTESVKQFIVNEPVIIQNNTKAGGKFTPSIFGKDTITSLAIQRPVSQITDKKNIKNEIFVDIFEKLTVLFNSNGYVINSSIDGVI